MLESLLSQNACLQACNFIKKRLQQRYFTVKFVKFLRAPILKNLFERLLLQFLLMPPVLESLLDKVTTLQSCNLKRLQYRCFPVKFPKFLRAPILKNICKRLLLYFLSYGSIFIIYVIDLSTKNRIKRRGFIFLQKSKIKTLGKRKKNFFS